MKEKRIYWSSSLAYAIGLLVTDGSLSKDKRHIVMVSKDTEQLENFKKALTINNKITIHKSSYKPSSIGYAVQFGDIRLYKFFNKIGIYTNKTRTIGKLNIPSRYYADFLRGHLDGDGCTYSYWDPRWQSSFMLYTVFVASSKTHIEWMKDKIKVLYGISGNMNCSILKSGKPYFRLVFAKRSSLSLIKILYKKKKILFLSRKKSKIDKALEIINQQADVLKQAYRPS